MPSVRTAALLGGTRREGFGRRAGWVQRWFFLFSGGGGVIGFLAGGVLSECGHCGHLLDREKVKRCQEHPKKVLRALKGALGSYVHVHESTYGCGSKPMVPFWGQVHHPF